MFSHIGRSEQKGPCPLMSPGQPQGWDTRGAKEQKTWKGQRALGPAGKGPLGPHTVAASQEELGCLHVTPEEAEALTQPRWTQQPTRCSRHGFPWNQLPHPTLMSLGKIGGGPRGLLMHGQRHHYSSETQHRVGVTQGLTVQFRLGFSPLCSPGCS